MVARSPAELVNLEIVSPDYFKAPQELLYRPSTARAVFGGQVIAQALHAASQTVSRNFQVHSFHCYFLLPGRTTESIYYSVQRLRDGRNFCTREVEAKQNGGVLFVMVAQFAAAVDLNRGLRYSASPPHPPPPEALISLAEFLAENPAGLSASARSRVERGLRSPVPVDQRFVHVAFLRADKSRRGEAVNYFEGGTVGGNGEVRDAPRRTFWLRVTEEIKDDSLHPIVFSFISDWPVLNTALEPLGSSITDRLTFIASLDHTIWFHRPGLRADAWLLFDLTCQQASSERAVVLCHVWNQQNQLMATVAQEGLIRVTQAKM